MNLDRNVGRWTAVSMQELWAMLRLCHFDCEPLGDQILQKSLSIFVCCGLLLPFDDVCTPLPELIKKIGSQGLNMKQLICYLHSLLGLVVEMLSEESETSSDLNPQSNKSTANQIICMQYLAWPSLHHPCGGFKKRGGPWIWLCWTGEQLVKATSVGLKESLRSSILLERLDRSAASTSRGTSWGGLKRLVRMTSGCLNREVFCAHHWIEVGSSRIQDTLEGLWFLGGLGTPWDSKTKHHWESPMTQAEPPQVSTINTGLQIGYETTGLSFNYFNITHEKSKIHCTVQ